MNEIYLHIWQKHLFGSPKILSAILEYYNFDAEKAWRDFNPSKWPNLSQENRQLIKNVLAESDPEKSYREITKYGIEIVPITSSKYPSNLKNTSVPPVALYCRGNLKHDKPAIGIVGTRKISTYGRKVVRELIRELSKYDVTIVSGLAYGVDAETHRKSLDQDLTNIAVLANGINEIYPKPHTNLSLEIIKKGGAVISETPPFVPSMKYMFPIRNRIIAGIADATVIIQSPCKSGSLITANYAFTENRFLYAVPGDITDYRQDGCHELIRNQKASLLTSAHQIIDDLKLTTLNLATRDSDLSDLQRSIFDMLDAKAPMHIDRISQSVKKSTKRLVGLLVEMEISGYVKNVGAMHYVRV